MRCFGVNAELGLLNIFATGLSTTTPIMNNAVVNTIRPDVKIP